MKFYYFVDKEGVRQGPLPLDDLSAYDISPTTLVWTKGMEKWMKAKDVADFSDILLHSQVTNDCLQQKNRKRHLKTLLIRHLTHWKTSTLMSFQQKKSKKNHLI